MITYFRKNKIKKTEKRIANIMKDMVSDRVLGSKLNALCMELRILEFKLRNLKLD